MDTDQCTYNFNNTALLTNATMDAAETSAE
jgi:hypothetical protein